MNLHRGHFTCGEEDMNKLLEKYNDYLRLVGCKAEYKLENGICIIVEHKKENFSYNNLTTLHYTDAIIDFNPHIIKSKINSDYILFEETPRIGEYNHMGIAKDVTTGSRYIETFFHETSDKYIRGQKVVKIKEFRLFDSTGNIIVEECF